MSAIGYQSSSLTKKLLAVYIPLVCVTMLLIFAVIEIRSYHRKVDRLSQAVKQLAQLQSGAFTKAVWEIDNERLESLLNDIQRTPGFRGAVVRDSFDQLLASVGDLEGEPELTAREALIFETEFVREQLGSLVVIFGREGIHSDLAQRLRSDALVLLLLALLLICITLLATRRLIVNPLDRLRKRVLKIADGAEAVTVVDLHTGDEIGELAGAFATMQQKVADREEALESARESALQELMESAPDAMVVANTNGRICRLNSAAATLFGYEAEALRGEPIESLLPERYRTGHGAHFSKYFENPQSRNMGTGLELFGIRRDGSEFPVEIGLSPFHDPDGQMAVAAIRDITERKKAEAELAEKEQRFRTLVDNLPGTVYRCLHDEHRTMLFISDDAESLTGYPAADMINNAVRAFDSVIHENDRARVADDIAVAVAGKEPWFIEYRILRSDGQLRWVGERGRAIFREDGEVDYLDGVIADITQQKEMETQLRMAREQAEAANHAKSDFLSSMSHELRTPLNGILGYAQILQRDKSSTPRQQDNVESIINCGDHLLSLINDVLDLSKIEAGQLELNDGPCDLAKLIKSIGDIVSQRARAKELEFTVDIAPEIPQGIILDAAKLRQILVNLLGNAVKFTTKGSVTLKVLESVDHQLVFEVIDTGVGMEPAEMELIFDPFKQVDAGKAAGGTGLGLAISERLVKRMGGTIEVESAIGHGSCFRISLPFEEVDVGDLSSLADDESHYFEAFLVPGQTVRILVADDRDTNRNILEQMLEEAGFEVHLADDGDTALEALRKNTFDMVLLDIRMPRLNGIEAIRQIRADDNLKTNKVIAVTASVFPEFKEKAIAAGFDDFLPKPFRVSELIHKLQHHLDAEWTTVAPTESGAEAKNPTDATNDGNLSLPKEALERFRNALRIKNMSALKVLAKDLSEESATASAGEKIANLTRAFDFDALAELEQKLSSEHE